MHAIDTSPALQPASFKEENVALPERLARDMFLLNITYDGYKTTVTDCKVRKSDLNECYEAINRWCYSGEGCRNSKPIDEKA